MPVAQSRLSSEDALLIPVEVVLPYSYSVSLDTLSILGVEFMYMCQANRLLIVKSMHRVGFLADS
jgi:hypothetical protein